MFEKMRLDILAATAAFVLPLHAASAEPLQTAARDCTAEIKSVQREAENTDLRPLAAHALERYLALAENAREAGNERKCINMVARARRKL